MIDATMAALEKTLDLRMRAHEVHTSNVANANVPGYKAKKVEFDARMREAMDSLESEDATLGEKERVAKENLESVAPEIYEDPLARASGDGNTVDAEREQAEIAKNTIAYQTAIQLLNKKFLLNKQVLSDGGR